MLKHIFRQSNLYLHKALSRSIALNLFYMLYRYLKVLLLGKRNLLSAQQLAVHRKSKLLIIGGGPSINKLDKDFFNKLQDYDVAAFSYAALLPVKIKYYFYEVPQGQLLNHHQRYLYPTLKHKHESKEIEHFILKNHNSNAKGLFNRFPFFKPSITFPIHISSVDRLFRMLKLVDFFKLSAKYFFQVRASLFSVCYWADALGYKEILLVGIDLNSSKYFYEGPNPWLVEQVPNPFSEDEQAVDAHPTSENTDGIKLHTAMEVLNEHISAKVYINNPRSALADIFEHKAEP